MLRVAAMHVRAGLEGTIVLDARWACTTSEACDAGRPGLGWRERDRRLTDVIATGLGDARIDAWENTLSCEPGQRCRMRGADHVVAFGAVVFDGDEARVRVYRASRLAPGSTLLDTEHYERDVTLVLRAEGGVNWTVVREEMVRVT